MYDIFSRTLSRRALKCVVLGILVAGCSASKSSSTSNGCASTSSACLTVSKLSPDFGSSKGGTMVFVRGTAFDTETKVLFDGLSVPVTLLDPTTATFMTPASSAGQHAVRVQGPETQVEKPFYVDPPPRLDSLPASVAPGITLNLTGTFLGPFPTVTLDGRVATVTAFDQQSFASLTIQLPFIPDGTRDLVVSNQFASTHVPLVIVSRWSARSTGLDAAEVSGVAIDSSGHFYAATPSGIFRSTDLGVTWSLPSSALLGAGVSGVAVDPSSQALFVPTQEGVYRSDDGGASWRLSSSKTNVSLAVAPGGQLIAGVYEDPPTAYSLQPDGSWKSFAALQIGYPWQTIGPLAATDTYLYWRTDSAIRRARLDGAPDDWSDSLVGVSALATLPDGNLLVADGSAIAKVGIADYSYTPMGTLADVHSLWVDPSGSGRAVAATGAGAYVSDDSGATWTSLSCWNGPMSDLHPNSDGWVYVGTIGFGVMAIPPTGSSCSISRTGMSSANVSQLIRSASSPNEIFAMTSGGLFRSLDGGGTWVRLETTPHLDRLEIDHLQASLLWARSGTNLLTSSDTGYHWLLARSDITDVAAGAGDVYAIVSNQVEHSTDGQNWTAVAGLTNPTSVFVTESPSHLLATIDQWGAHLLRAQWEDIGRGGYALRSVSGSPVLAWAGTDSEEFSVDEGATWSPIPDPQISQPLYHQGVAMSPDHLFVQGGLPHAGLYVSSLSPPSTSLGPWQRISDDLWLQPDTVIAIGSGQPILAGTPGIGVLTTLE
jgi:hypothetical protein